MTEQLDIWDETAADQSITTEQLDEAVVGMKQAEEHYKTEKKMVDAHYACYQEKRAVLIAMLQQAGKSKYHVDGWGTASLTTKLKVRTPKDLVAKEALLNYMEETLGKDGMLAYASVNYQSLNSFYNEEFERAKEAGTADDFSIPGLETPDSEVGLSFRK